MRAAEGKLDMAMSMPSARKYPFLSAMKKPTSVAELVMPTRTVVVCAAAGSVASTSRARTCMAAVRAARLETGTVASSSADDTGTKVDDNRKENRLERRARWT